MVADKLRSLNLERNNMEYEIKSRYGDIHKITDNYDDSFNFIAAENCREFMRFGFKKTPDAITFVDPSGGPFISVGTKLSDYSEDLPSKTIRRIEMGEDGIKLFV